jgi:chromosome partitioning protein
MKVAMINGKGGSGKTTVSILLAAALAEAGHTVAVEDTDPQQTASTWIRESANGLSLRNPRDTYTAVMIDTPPRLDSPHVIRAMREADIVLVVTSPSPADLFTSRDTVQILKREGMAEKGRILFNQVQVGTILSRDLDDLAQRMGLPALRSRIQRRQAYQHAVLTGWRSLPSEARDEIFRVALEVAALPHPTVVK